MSWRLSLNRLMELLFYFEGILESIFVLVQQVFQQEVGHPLPSVSSCWHLPALPYLAFLFFLYLLYLKVYYLYHSFGHLFIHYLLQTNGIACLAHLSFLLREAFYEFPWNLGSEGLFLISIIL